jgi:hypothetical protein
MELIKKKIQYNKPQLRSQLIDAPISVNIMGRATGKTEGIEAVRIARRVHSMRRSLGLMLHTTYQRLLTNVLPGLILGWEKLGYKQNVHYFIQKFAPTNWNWLRPYRAPVISDYFIHWYTGSGIAMVSQDRPFTGNGLSVDWIECDEAKTLNKKKFDEETVPSNRGNRQYFANDPNHHGIGFYTDMPIGKQGKWLFDYEKMMDKDACDLILAIQYKIIKLQHDQLTASKTLFAKLSKQIFALQNDIAFVRKDLVYYGTASSLENIDVLGTSFFSQQRRVLPSLVYNAAILNIRQNQVEGGFYPLLDEDKHCYDAYNYAHLDQTDFNKIPDVIDCRQDADLVKDMPLEISLDSGGSINAMVVAQQQRNLLKFVNALYVLHPFRFKDVLLQFVNYYRFHEEKTVYYYHDHTMIGLDGKEESFYESVHKVLSENDWIVIDRYIGQQPRYPIRYKEWGDCLKEDNSRLIVRFNRYNCKELILSMQGAQIKEGHKGIEKNKLNEKDPNYPQEEATHLSDAADTLLIGKLNSKRQNATTPYLNVG